VVVVLLDFALGPDEEQFESVFNGDPVVVGPTVHEELGEMEKVLAFCSLLVQSAAFVHVDEFLLGYLLIQPFVEFPQHQVHFALRHLHPHLLQHLSHLELGEVFFPVAGG